MFTVALDCLSLGIIALVLYFSGRYVIRTFKTRKDVNNGFSKVGSKRTG